MEHHTNQTVQQKIAESNFSSAPLAKLVEAGYLSVGDKLELISKNYPAEVEIISHDGKVQVTRFGKYYDGSWINFVESDKHYEFDGISEAALKLTEGNHPGFEFWKLIDGQDNPLLSEIKNEFLIARQFSY